MITVNKQILDQYQRYDKYCIFKNNNIDTNDTKIRYNNIKYIFPIMGGSFHACLGIQNNKVIPNTNSFINDPAAKKEGYEYAYRMHARINITYDYLQNHEYKNIINQTVCNFITPFDSANIGHNLSIIFDYIHQYRALNLDCPIVLSEHSKKYTNALNIIKLFFSENEIIFIENDTVYQFEDIYILRPEIFRIQKHNNIITECHNKIIKTNSNIDYFKNKNIVLIKTTHNQNMVNKRLAFKIDSLKKYLESLEDWIILDPENNNIYDIIRYVTYANKIITCFGAINYAHAPFFSHNAQIFFLQNPNNPLDLPYFPHPHQVIIPVDTDLDSQIHILKEKIGF
jgi:hypothetical protein